MTATHTPALSIGSVTIREHDGLYSLNDLHRASGSDNKHRPSLYLANEQTKALIAEIDKAGIPAFRTTRGRYASTYACRELVIAYAAWISAAFHLKVIRVFLDTVAPAQHPLPLPAPAPALDAAAVNDLITHTAEGIFERLEKRCLLIHWRQVITAIKHDSTEMTFSDLTDLTHACLTRLQRRIDAEAYSVINQRAANRNQTTATVSLAA